MFGMKVHFPHFEAALTWYPSMLSVLSPVTYIYVNRKDKLAQAVSMAKAMQTDAWSTMGDNAQATLIYNGALIARCLRELLQQRLGWLRRFEIDGITPLTVYYEDLVADTASVIHNIRQLARCCQR